MSMPLSPPLILEFSPGDIVIEIGNPYGLTQLRPGDVVVMDAAGGGGYGDPLDRAPELVEGDVVEGYVSVKSAQESYGVVIDPDTMKVDMDATRKLRESLKTV